MGVFETHIGRGDRRGALLLLLLVAGWGVTGCGYKTHPRPAAASIPGEVEILDVRARPRQVVLRWSIPRSDSGVPGPGDLSGFKLFRWSGAGDEACEDCQEKLQFHANVDFQKPLNARLDEGTMVFWDKDVRVGRSYAYSVSAHNLQGMEGRRSEIVTIRLQDLPPVPKDLSVQAKQDGVLLQWASPSTPAGIRSYQIYRSDGPDAGFEPLGTTKWAETVYLDQTAKRGKSYSYRIRSVKIQADTTLESGSSRIVKITYPPLEWGPPDRVNVTALEQGIEVHWEPVAIPDEKALYFVYRSEAGQAFERLSRQPIAAPRFLDSEVTQGTEYRYKVSAFPAGQPEKESRRTTSESIVFRR